jgi:hypothetical protein
MAKAANSQPAEKVNDSGNKDSKYQNAIQATIKAMQDKNINSMY